MTRTGPGPRLGHGADPDADPGSGDADAVTRADGGGGRPEAVVLVSGGMDSATTAYEARERGYALRLLHTSYGQNTEAKERECAAALAASVDAVDFLRVETDHLARIGASALTAGADAVGDGALDADDGGDADGDGDSGDAGEPGDAVPSTYVPFRNANLLSMAVSYAEATGSAAVFVGAHSEDYAGYPDCRPAFFEAFQRTVDAGTRPDTAIAVEAPFVEASKTDIAARGLELGVPFELTWSCYRDDAPACGTCDACAYRLQAFQRLGVDDPIEYASRPDYAGVDDPTDRR